MTPWRPCYRSFCASHARFAVTPLRRSTTHRYTEHSCGPHLPRLIRLNDPSGAGVTVTFTERKERT